MMSQIQAVSKPSLFSELLKRNAPKPQKVTQKVLPLHEKLVRLKSFR